MKVCFVMQKLVGLSGGAERILVDVCNGLAARGMDVTILTYDSHAGAPYYPLTNVVHRNLFPAPRAPRATKGKTRRLERTIKAIPNIWPLPQLKWAVTYGPFIRRLHHALSDIKPDVVVGFLPTGIMAAVQASGPLNIPVIASTHNVPEQDFGDGGRWDANPLYRKRRNASLAQASRILVLQKDFKDWFEPTLAHKISVMPNPVFPATLPLDRPRTKQVIGVGRLTDIKRYDVLIAAWGQIHAKHPDWQLKIYGEGPERQNLQSQIDRLGLANNITLAGVTTDIMRIYTESAILCHPSAFEGFGLSVAEALAHGLPVVADVACSGVNALIKDGQTGCLIDTGNAVTDAFAAALDTLISDPDTRARMGAAASVSMQPYAPAKVFAQWEALLRSCQSDPNLV